MSNNKWTSKTIPDQSGRTIIITGSSSGYYGPHGFKGWRGYPVKCTSNKLSQDKNIAAELWQISEQLTDMKFAPHA